jgi:hypothetical protein
MDGEACGALILNPKTQTSSFTKHHESLGVPIRLGLIYQASAKTVTMAPRFVPFRGFSRPSKS